MQVRLEQPADTGAARLFMAGINSLPKAGGALCSLEHFRGYQRVSGPVRHKTSMKLQRTFEYARDRQSASHRLEFRHDHAGTKFFPSGGGRWPRPRTRVVFSQVMQILEDGV